MGRTVKCFKEDGRISNTHNPYLCYIMNMCNDCDLDIRINNIKMGWSEMYRMLNSPLITGLYKDTIYRYYDRKPSEKL